MSATNCGSELARKDSAVSWMRALQTPSASSPAGSWWRQRMTMYLPRLSRTISWRLAVSVSMKCLARKSLPKMRSAFMLGITNRIAGSLMVPRRLDSTSVPCVTRVKKAMSVSVLET